MPNQHKTPGITWHPADPTLKDRIKAEAVRRETTASRILDEGMTEYLDGRDHPPAEDVTTGQENQR